MAVSELPGNPNAVWTVKKRADGNIWFFFDDFRPIFYVSYRSVENETIMSHSVEKY